MLQNGGLEVSVAPLGWTTTEFITGEPGSPITTTEHVSFANSPNDTAEPHLGVLLRTAAGNSDFYAGQNKAINYTLSQSVAIGVNQSFVLSADAFLGSTYSGAVEFLNPFSPSDPDGTGTVPSPTETRIELAFLDATSAVIGTPIVKDLRDSTIFDDWETHTLMATSPTGTARARVSVSALDVVDNSSGQTVYFDNFKLVRQAQTNDRLSNGNLNVAGALADWTVDSTPSGPEPNVAVVSFAHHVTESAPAGQGLWLRAFAEGDATITHTVPAIAGGEYAFSAWTLWEPNYSGGVPESTPTRFSRWSFSPKGVASSTSRRSISPRSKCPTRPGGKAR